jgi:hypothetical protein
VIDSFGLVAISTTYSNDILGITVIDCNTIKIVISGTDGNKTSNTVRLAGIIGSSCT